MSLEQTTELYAAVLRHLLPEGVYDTAEMTHVADDIYAHAKALAQADIDAHRLLQVLETIPVDLLSDYEREYGLPMQCMVPGTQTIEERISVLRWIRQHRNVMNREYLEQILAIFGVTLVDVVKHYPMQCTTQCTAPVNTERLRYKVLLRLQYPMTADMSCIIENYLPGYLRVKWVVDMPWGEWILNAGYELIDDNIRYTAYKTNQRDFYDSFANFDLVTALIRSFHDEDMQQWQSFVSAVNELTLTTSWVIDTANETLTYTDQTIPPEQNPTIEWLWTEGGGVVNKKKYGNVTDAARSTCIYYNEVFVKFLSPVRPWDDSQPLIRCRRSDGYLDTWNVEAILNPIYSSMAQPIKASLSFMTIAQKIISNATSSNEGISLLAETYIQAVANSIFNTDPAKQFVRLSELISQFEENKILRT